MDQKNAIALVMYIQKATGTVPTTGAEWEQLRPAIMALEAVAGGRSTIEVKDVAPAA